MRMIAALALTMLAAAAPAGAQSHHEVQRRLWDQTRAGQILPLKEIERRVIPTMGGWQYIGVSFEPDAAVYTLTFLRNGVVAKIDVDARTGAVVGRDGG